MVFRDKRILKWGPREELKVQAVEMHTGVKPLRVLTGGLPEIKGKTILEKRRHFLERFDHIRTGSMWEPRGHDSMYGAVLTEPVTPDVSIRQGEIKLNERSIRFDLAYGGAFYAFVECASF